MELCELIDTIDIVAYISQFVEMEEHGGEMWGLSPFKDEKTPSFSVRPDPPCFFDYSSGIGGNVFTFVRYYFHCNAAEAVAKLREYVGDDGSGAGNSPSMKLGASQVCRRFKKRERKHKTSGGRGFPDDVMLRYEKRPEKLAVWENEGITKASLERFQVFYDPFSDRLVYPIRDLTGRIVNIGGRTLDPEWKDKGLRKYTYFSKWDGGIDLLYGLYDNLDAVRAGNELIVFEGCKSVLIADGWGIHNTAALLTSHLSDAQLRILAKLGCRVVFALDRDVDIRKDHNINRLRRYCAVEYLRDTDGLLGEKDSPVDRGKEVFQKLYESRVRFT